MRLIKKYLGACAAGAILLGMGSVARSDTPASRPSSRPSMPLSIFSSPQEWDSLMDFLNANSPNRAKVIQGNTRLAESIPLRQAMLRQYRAYELMREQFPEVADLRLKQFKLEDDVFDLTRQAHMLNPGRANAEFRPKIRDKESQILDLQLQQEELRIDRLQKVLDDERNRLAASRGNLNQMIDERTNQALPRFRRGTGATPSVAAGPSSKPSDVQDVREKSSGLNDNNPIVPMSPDQQ